MGRGLYRCFCGVVIDTRRKMGYREGGRAVLGIVREIATNREKVLYKDRINNPHGEFSCHGLEKRVW